MPLRRKKPVRYPRHAANRRSANRRPLSMLKGALRPPLAAAAVRPMVTNVGGSLEIALPEPAVATGTTLTIYCSCLLPGSTALVLGTDKPGWHSATKRLDFRGEAAKPLRRDALNMQTVLEAFECADWPEWIADPLPRAEVDVRDRLYNTVKRLNRHFAGMIHFSCDGRGTGLFWHDAASLDTAAEQCAPMCGKKRPNRTRRTSAKGAKAPQSKVKSAPMKNTASVVS